MSALKDLRINGFKNLKGIGLRNLGINGLKDVILKPRQARDTDIESLTKSREEVKRKIRALVREKKELESRIVELQKTGGENNKKIFGSSWQEKKMVEKTEELELKETGKEEKLDKIGIKAEEIEAKPANRTAIVEGNEVLGLNDIAGKRFEEIAFTKKEGKTKTVDSILSESTEDLRPDKDKTGSEKPVQGIFGGSLIEELLENEDLYPEEEQSFMKYIEESSVTELISDLKEVRKLLA